MKILCRTIITLTIATFTCCSTIAAQWKSIGNGRWSEGLLCEAAGTVAGLQWDVEIEGDADSPGLYRMLPYHSGSPVAQQLGTDMVNYVIVDATEAQHVFIREFSAFGVYTVSHLVPENGWASFAEYGKLADGAITFPAGAFSVKTAAGWTAADTGGTFSITLPSNAAVSVIAADPAAGQADRWGNPSGSRYLTLQGQPAATLRPGCIYICIPPAPASPYKFLAR